jgi:4-amino-4-deoxychorismate lyase
MKRLLETICIIDGQPQNIIYHNQRFNQASRHFWNKNEAIDLYEKIKVPTEMTTGAIRCRILYKNEIEEIQYIPYQYKQIKSLQLINTDLDYSYKFEDRTAINNLYKQKNNADDILMVKNGLITDTSYANIVFKAGNKLFTPSQPMLHGTKRAKLMYQKIIQPMLISISDLQNFSHFCIINSFLNLDDANFQSVKNIIH